MELVAEKHKQTALGLIPCDWEMFILGDLLNGIADVNHYMPKTETIGIPYVMTGDLKELVSDIDFENCKKINLEDYKELSKKVKNLKGDIILARYATIGTVSYVNIDFEFIVSYSCVTVKPNTSKLKSLFLFYYFKSNLFKLEVRNIVNANIQDNVGIGDLYKMQIPLPPTIEEQTIIATALSDADTLISSLEKLIAKKRNIKQGAMQKLLQPKEGWDVKKLGEIGKPYGGLSGKSKIDFADGKYPYIPFMNIMSNPIIDTSYFDYVNIGSNEMQNQAIKGDLFFNGSSETPEEVGMCSMLLEDVPNLYLNSFCFGFRLNKESKINGLYLSYFFRSSEGRKLFYLMAQGATRYNLSKSNFNKLELSLPTPEVQNEIAQIISDMDAEINALETKLEKYRKVKLGMMQNLLTGKIRLI